MRENCALFECLQNIEMLIELPAEIPFKSSAEIPPESPAEISFELPAELTSMHLEPPFEI